MLDVDDVTVAYGAIKALDQVSLHVDQGQIIGLIGSNGAGKSSLLKGICAAAPVVGGEITFQGCSLTRGSTTHRTIRKGIAHVPEGRRVIAPLTVEENLILAAEATGSSSQLIGGVYELFPRLNDRRRQLSGSMSGGEQQMLAIGRALISSPKLILMDEPSMGLAPIIITEIYRMFKERNELTKGVAFLVAEQSAALALSISERTYVLTNGKVSWEGSSSELREDSNELHRRYLRGDKGA